MSLSLAQDAIALLIDLAERGEIDPWDVKVIDVIDRFLTELDPFEVTGREPYEANLSQSGQAFLYASMLLLLKAESLTQSEAQQEAELEEEAGEFLQAEGGGSPLPPFLERQLQRRAAAPPVRRRRVTLKELIDQLQTIASALEEQGPRPRRVRRPRPQSRSQAIRAIAQLAHQENLSEMAVALEQFFSEHWTAITQGQGWLDFELLLEFWKQLKAKLVPTPAPDSTDNLEEAHPSPNHDRVGVFWALLLLSAQSKVELAQDEFYQDLKVQLLFEQLEELSASTSLD